MLKRALLSLATLVIFAATASNGQSIGGATGFNCTVVAGVPGCVPLAGTSSIIITAANADFLKLRDALTPNWNGTMRCSECDVLSGFPGCTAEGVVVATTRNKACLAKIGCILRSIVKERDRRDLEAAIVVAEPVIGGGDPG